MVAINFLEKRVYGTATKEDYIYVAMAAAAFVAVCAVLTACVTRIFI